MTDQALATLYKDIEIYATDKAPRISWFKPPIYAANPKPVKEVTLKQINQAITGDFFKAVTLELTKQLQRVRR